VNPKPDFELVARNPSVQVGRNIHAVIAAVVQSDLFLARDAIR
jgi:hypothetical protein